VTEVRSTIEDFFHPVMALPSVGGVSRGVDATHDDTVAHYSTVPKWRRQLAAAALLSNLGMFDHMEALLSATPVPLRETDARIAASKLRARWLRREGKRGQALGVLLTPRMWRYDRQAQQIANEVAATLPGTRFYRLADPVDRLLLRRVTLSKTRFEIETRRASRRAFAGNLRDASEMFQDIDRYSSQGVVGLGNWVNFLTWRADLMKVMGDVRPAIQMLERDLDETFYADASQAATIEWKLTELQLVANGPQPGTIRKLRELAEHGSAVGTTQLQWIRMTLAGADPDLTKEERAALLTDTRDVHAALFGRLLQAEHARAEGACDTAQRMIAEALRLESTRTRWAGCPTARIAGLIFLRTAEAQAGDAREPAAAKALSMLAEQAEEIGADLTGAHARCNAALLGGKPVDAATVSHWSDRGWSAEVKRAEGGTPSLYERWQVVI
jgi:hypothetical protein